MTPFGIGIIGAGVISDTYIQNLVSFPDVKVLAVGDLDPERARLRAEQYDIPSWGGAEDVLNHPDVQIVVNLTIPAAHVDISEAAIRAGKHVWTEKPIGLDRESVDRMLALAAEHGVRIGSAPDTVLGPGIQTAKRAIESGIIGMPLFAQTIFQTQGPDLWHPNPDFLFVHGAGPLLDMGPYYFTALVNILGSVKRVAAMGQAARTERVIRTGPRANSTFPVEVPTTMQVLAEFHSGVQSQSLFSFDSALEQHGVIQIHGTEGSIMIPDPNRFTGATAYVKPLATLVDGQEIDQPWIGIEEHGTVVGRGLGVLEMARAIAADRPHLASGDMGRHVLDILLSSEQSAETNQFVDVLSSVAPVASIPVDFDPFSRTL